MDSTKARDTGGQEAAPREDLTADLLRFAAAAVTLVVAIALGLVR
ncbi:MAG: hypothetical protein ACJ77B_05290 [Chloroflexota bacterium]|jgi:hypothetical protein